MTYHADGLGYAGIDGHLDVPVVIANKQRVTQIQIKRLCGALNHHGARLPAVTGSVQMGADFDDVKRPTAPCSQAVLHARVNLIQLCLAHEALAHTLLAGHQHQAIAMFMTQLCRLHDAFMKVK